MVFSWSQSTSRIYITIECRIIFITSDISDQWKNGVYETDFFLKFLFQQKIVINIPISAINKQQPMPNHTSV